MATYRLSDQALGLWLNYIEHQIGFVLPKSQYNWVKGIIERHMTRMQQDSTALLQAMMHDTALYHQLVDDILIPSTQFFRHIPTFKFAEAYALAWHLQQQNQQKTFTAWSVGCSTGQEAVTISLCLELALHGVKNFQVFGSDFHQRALAEATLGQYDNDQKRFIPMQYRNYLADIGHNKFALILRLKSHVHFFSHNLVDLQQVVPLSDGQCQLIVCKNVLIYFRQFEQRDIVHLLTRYLADDGILLLGSGQNLAFNPPNLQKIEHPTINGYCKNVAPSWVKKLANS